MFKKYVFDSGRAGRRCLVLGAVHGNETAGTFAQQRLIREISDGIFRLKTGTVTFIPVVNEAARQEDRRFIDVNLNRVICRHQRPQNNEEKIANLLINEINACDIMLDLHSTHCPEDEAFAFIDYPSAGNLELLSVIPVKYALAGWPAIYADNPSIANHCTEEYAYTCGKNGLTVECGYHKSPQAVNIARQSIINILAHFGIFDLPEPKISAPETITLESFVIKTGGGRLSRTYKHLDTVAENETIAVCDDGTCFKAPSAGRIIMPNPEAAVGSEWFYFGR